MKSGPPNLWLYRYASLVALCTLLLIGTGAFVTSSRKASEAIVPASHILTLAIVVGALALGLAVWLFLSAKRPALRWLSSGALVIYGLEGWTASISSSAAVVTHACLAPLLFTALVAICLLLSPGWPKGPQPVENRGFTALPALAIAAPPVVLVQIALGAAYRHKVTGIMPHMAGAMIAALLTLVVSVVILQQYPDHRPLKSAATAVLSIVLLQVTLGVTAFIIELLDLGNSPALLFSTVSHVVVGSLTLAATLVLALQVRRNVHA